MRRILMVLLVILLPTACMDSGNGGYGQTYGPADCSRFTSCATCTPVLGCGWCSMGTKGVCVDQPNACAGVPNFSWTWELNFCPASGDAGVSGDGGVSGDAHPSGDAGVSGDGGPPSHADAAPAADSAADRVD